MANKTSFGIDFKTLVEGLKKVEAEITNLHETIKDGTNISKNAFIKLSDSLTDVFKNSI